MPFCRIAAVAALALVAAACGDDRPPPPRDAAQACLAAIEQAGLEATAAHREALACPRLYRDDGCAEAWTAAAAADERRELIDGLRRVRSACRRACVRLSGGVPPKACLESEDRPGLADTVDGRVVNEVLDLDRGLHEVAGLRPAEAERLARRVSLLALLVPVSTDVALAPDDPTRLLARSPRDPVALGSTALEIHVTSTGFRVFGVTVNAAQLRDALDAHAATADPDDRKRAVIHSDPDVPYSRVVEVLQIAREAGVTDVVFAVDRSDSP